MRILFAGTPYIAVPSLQAMARAEDIDVAAVLTAPDKVSGRGRKISPPAVKAAAVELGIPVLQPHKLGADARGDIAALNADLLVVFAYGKIFGPKFLSLFPMGGINMHPSALPRYRGPAPVSAAIMNGDSETALTVQQVALEMDAGDIIRQIVYPLSGDETTGSLTDSIALAAAPELLEALRSMKDGTAVFRPQDHKEASYCSLVEKGDGIIDWNSSAEAIERQIRACYPWPKARSSLKGEGLVILEADCLEFSEQSSFSGGPPVPGTFLGVDKSQGLLLQSGNGVLGIKRLQLAARKPLDFQAFLNGVSLEIATILGDEV